MQNLPEASDWKRGGMHVPAKERIPFSFRSDQWNENI